jgi:hypothetical protein
MAEDLAHPVREFADRLRHAADVVAVRSLVIPAQAGPSLETKTGFPLSRE